MHGQNDIELEYRTVDSSSSEKNETESDNDWLVVEKQDCGEKELNDDHGQTKENFTLMEELELLSNKKTAFLGDGYILMGLCGCILIELEHRGRIALMRSARGLLDWRVVLGKANKTGNELLDEVLQQVMDIETPQTVREWIQHLSNVRPLTDKIEDMISPTNRPKKLKSLRKRVREGLVSKGVMGTEKWRYILFKRTNHPLIDDEQRNRVVKKIQDCLLSGWPNDPRKINSRILALVVMSYYSYVFGTISESLSPSDYNLALSQVKTFLKNFKESPKKEALNSKDNELIWILIEVFEALHVEQAR